MGRRIASDSSKFGTAIRALVFFFALFASRMTIAADAQPTISLTHARVSTSNVLEADSTWEREGNLISLTQRDPQPGEPTAYLSEVRVLADSNHLYIRVRCVDPHPGDVAIHTQSFDGDQTNDDRITIVLDTFGKHRTGYEFDVNAAGNRSDGLISPAAPLATYDWNGDWTANVRRDIGGWTATIAIDTRSLQFPTGATTWGFNVLRYVPREQLTLQWSGITRDAQITDLSRMGLLTGVEAFAPSLGWEIAPYAVVRANQGNGLSGEAGVDVRYNVTPDLAAILTVNPDFAEAQVDAQQINLTPYALFKPEKRQFFLEGSNQFTYAYGVGAGAVFIPFYSRTVGLVGDSTVRLDDGVKVIGQAGNWSVGALDVQMGKSSVSAPTNLFVGRLAYDVDENLRVGLLHTNGDPTGTRDNSFNGVDAVWHTSRFRGDKNLTVSGWVARSSGDLPSGRRDGWGVYIEYPNDLWRWVVSDNTFGEALDPALGFLPRPGTHQVDLYLGYYPRPQGERFGWVRQFFYESEYFQVDDLHGNTQTRQLTVIPFNVKTQNDEHLEFHWAPEYEFLTQPFEISPHVVIAPGGYTFNQYHLQAESSAASALRAGAQLQAGTFYDGHLIQIKPYVNWNSSSGALSVELDNETDWVHLAEGHFVQKLYQLKLTYALSPDMTLSSFAQYASNAGPTGVNVQWHWILSPGREFYFVFNHDVLNSVTEPLSRRQSLGNEFLVKLHWDFRL